MKGFDDSREEGPYKIALHYLFSLGSLVFESLLRSTSARGIAIIAPAGELLEHARHIGRANAGSPT